MVKKESKRVLSILVAICAGAVIFEGTWAAKLYRKGVNDTLIFWTVDDLRAFVNRVSRLPDAERQRLLDSPYWGPLTPELLRSLGMAPERFIDPFDRELPKSQWRDGPEIESGWKGKTLKVRGGNLQFYCDGAGFWIVIGRGPDGALDLSREAIDANLAALKKNPSEDSILSSYEYDPSNGTVSSGDIWRIPD